MAAKERDPKVTHKIMSAIPSKDTEPELMLRKALWKENLRYRVNYRKLPGKPDIVFTKYHAVVMGITGTDTIGLSVVWVHWKRNLLAILNFGGQKSCEILKGIQKSIGL